MCVDGCVWMGVGVCVDGCVCGCVDVCLCMCMGLKEIKKKERATKR